MSIRNLKIGGRLYAGFGILVVLSAVVAAIIASMGNQTSQAIVDMNRTSGIVKGLKDALLSSRQARALTWYYVATGDSAALRDREDAFAKLDKQYTDLEQAAVTETGHKLIQDFYENVMAFKDKAAQLSTLKQTGMPLDDPKFVSLINETTASQKVSANDKAVDWYTARSDQFRDIADASVSRLLFWSVCMGAASVLIGMGCAWLIGRSIVRPIARMTKAMGDIASGDLSVDVPALSNRDEIGSMAQAVQVFKLNGLKAMAQDDELERTRRHSEAERERSEAERGTVAQQQTHVVDAIAHGLEKLSDGALTFRIAQAFAADYDKLRVNFNGAMEKLQDTMVIVATNTSAIRSGTDEISTAADDLSRRTEQQAASLEETAAALDEITATVRKTAESSKHARQVVGQAKQTAEHSGEVVRQAVQAMSGIEQSSNQIGNIIGVIDEIAFQTNLLALNAGVEAARAGDAGRGFAVVASEVRALAQRSAEAAKEIKTLISASSAQVEQGVDLVGQTGKALDKIVIQVAEINGIVSEIAASAQEQATGLDQVNTAVNQMDQVTQQNAAMVEESTAASHALSKETDELSRLISQFQVGGTVPATSVRKPARSVARPAVSLKTTGRSGGAARKPAPEAQHDAWQEF